MEVGFAPVQSQPGFESMRTQATLAESPGSKTLWAHERHDGRMMYPDPLMTLAALVASYHKALLANGKDSSEPTLNRIVCVVDSAAREKQAQAFKAVAGANARCGRPRNCSGLSCQKYARARCWSGCKNYH